MLTFKEEIAELCSKYNKKKKDLAVELGCNASTISRMGAELFIPSEEMLYGLKKSLPAFDIEHWRIYFGKMPDEFYDACKKNPEFMKKWIYTGIQEVFSNQEDHDY